MKPRTIYDKLFHQHVVMEKDDGTVLLYIGKYWSAGMDEGLKTRS